MIDLFAYIGGLFAMISFVPQIHKSLRTRSTGDISWLLLVTTLISIVAYEIYALLLWLVPVILMNGIFIATVVLMIGIKWQLDRKSARLA